MCGAFIFGIIADKYGRRRVIVTSAILNTVFGIFTAFAPSYYWILIARILVGFALSGASQGFVKIKKLFIIIFNLFQFNFNA
jgi:MFS family permease